MALKTASELYETVHIDFRDLKVTFQFSSQNCDFWTSDSLGNRNAFMTHFVFFFLQNIHHWSFSTMVSIDRYCKENAWELDGLNFDLLRKIRQFSKLLHGIPMLLEGYGNWKRKLSDLQSDFRDPTAWTGIDPRNCAFMASELSIDPSEWAGATSEYYPFIPWETVSKLPQN